jgi:hypothetical protein
MTLRDRISGLSRLLRLRAQRVDSARRTLAAAQAAVAEAERALAARDAAILEQRRQIEALDAWFAQNADARLIETTLARRHLCEDRRSADIDARHEDVRRVTEALEVQAEAVRGLMRATARHDAVEIQLTAARRTRARQGEDRDHEEFEDRSRPRLALVQGAAA